MNRRSETYAVKMFTAGKVLLALVLAYAVVEAVLSQAGIVDSSAPGAVVPAAATHQKAQSTQDTLGKMRTQMPKRNPFQAQDNRYQRQPSAISRLTQIDATGSTDLKLVLLGTISGSPSVARAIIKDLQSDTLEPYKIGQQVGAGYVDRIEKDRVFVCCWGRTYVLRLEMGQAAAAPTQIADSRQNQSPTAEPQQQSAAQPDAVFAAEEPSSPQTPIASLESVLKQAKVEPYQLQGEVQGLVIASLDNVPAAKEAGLRNGDVIQQVNGHKLLNKQQAWQVIKKARSQDTIDIQVLHQD